MVTADEIRSRTFLVALRGYDRDEVKAFLSQVAETVAALQERARELEALEAARGTEDRVGEPEAEAAGEPSTGERSEREAGPAGPSPFAEIGQQTQRILEAAQQSAEDILARTRAEAERELKQARAEAARIIADGERRREDVERVVEALTGARAALSEDLRGVGRTIERVLRELGPEPAAATVREALAAAARDDAGAQPPAGDAAVPGKAGERDGEVAGDAAPQDGPPGEGDSEVVAGTPAAAAPSEDPAGEEPGEGDDPGAAAEQSSSAAVGEPGEADREPVPEPSGEAAGDGAEAAGAVDGEGPPAEGAGEAGAPPAATGARAALAGDGGAAPEERPAGGGTGTGGRAAVATAARGPAAGDATGSVATATPGAPDPAAEGGHQLLRRTQALAPLHPRLVRKLKRGLQDLQNATLDLLRRNPERSDVEPFLPDSGAVQALAALAGEQLALANAAGIAAGGEATGESASLEPSGAALAAQLGSELGGVLVTRLADTLRSGFDAGQGMSALTERVDVVFTRMKSQAAGDVAAVALVRAYEGGQRDAWTASGITHRRWVRAVEPACTDPRCVDNEAAGPVPVGERFPSRHDAPPVRPGCHCSTAPVLR